MADETTITTTETGTQQPPPKTQPATTEDAPTLTQKQVDAIIGNTRKEASAASLTALAKELGYDSVDDMKTAAKEAKARQEKDMSELEKATKRAEQAEAKAAAKEAELVEVAAARLADKVDSALKEAASNAKASKPANVVKWLRMEKKAAVEKLVGEDGVIDEKAVEKLIADFKKEEPTWFALTGHGSPSNRDGRPPQPDNKVVLNKAPRL